jgi:hypothetical protein
MARTTAIGCRAHSGWAVIVAVAGTLAAPVVLERKRIELLDGSLPVQPYHAAAESGLSRAETTGLITRVEDLAATAAAEAFGEMAAEVRANGSTVAGVAIVVNDRRLPHDLDQILRSHPLLYAAEGDLYEDALVEGAVRAGLHPQRLAASLSIPSNVNTLGRSLGPPWQKDHKMAASGALSLLATAQG